MGEKLTGDYLQFRYSVLVATRNRPEALANLLTSLETLDLPPIEVVIVSSGLSINHTLRQFDTLNIKHAHTQKRGQIWQKQLGITLVSEASDWVLFLDDDLILHPDALSKLFKCLKEEENQEKILGLGLRQYPVRNLSCLKRLMLSFMKFNSPGSITRTSVNTNYMFENRKTYTSWLNGASMWRKGVLPLYSFEILNSPTSYCEDLIFSYRVSKKGKLVAAPNAYFQFQNNSHLQVTSLTTFRDAVFWKAYFILDNREFSFLLFYSRQLLVSIYLLIKYLMKTGRIYPYPMVMFDLLVDLIGLRIHGRDFFLKRLQNRLNASR